MKPWKNYSGKARKALAPSIARGEATCSKCGRRVLPGQLWDVDHIAEQDRYPELADAPSNWAIAHRRCNRASGARYGNAKRANTVRLPPPAPPSREW